MTPRRRTRPSPELIRLEKTSEGELLGLILNAEEQKWKKNEAEEEEETVGTFRPPMISQCHVMNQEDQRTRFGSVIFVT